MSKYTFIFSGGSITNSIWPSWREFTLMRYGIKEFVDNAYPGVGNEFLINSTINFCQEVKNPFVFIMLTNIDKWDWYVENQDVINLINTNEKHPIRPITGKLGEPGYWSTGSWFPSYKEYFKDHYYSEQQFIANTLKNLYILQMFLSNTQIPHLILFDSPILTCTEQELNTGKIIQRDMLSDNKLAKTWDQLIDYKNIYLPGLIGFCEQQNLQWFNPSYRGHPPSSSHYSFAETQIFPSIDKLLPVINKEKPEEIINRYQEMYNL